MLRFPMLFSILVLNLFLVPTVIYAQTPQTTETTTTSTTQTPSGPVTTQRRVITTTVPAAKETITTPSGFVSCTTVAATWENNVWIPEHRVCKYENSPLGVAWVEGYWSCTKYTLDTGECTNWDWIAAHWVKTYSVY